MTNNVIDKAITTSKSLYTRGLEAAQLRDLGSAVEYLNRSLKFNKKNIQARNLLGLVYFEMGETVEAIKQWKTVLFIDPDDKKATRYIDKIFESPSSVERLNGAAKKYNQALEYAKQGNVDLAVIQLKKVTSLNIRFVKAYELLALCYIKENQIDKAVKALKNVLKIDRNNYKAKHYLEGIMQGDVVEEDIFEIQRSSSSGFMNNTNFSLSSSLLQLVALLLGVAIGISVIFFLIMPNKISLKDDEIKTLNDKLITVTADYNTAVASYEAEKLTASDYQDMSAQLQGELDLTETQLDEVSKLVLALNNYVEGEKVIAADELFVIDEADLTGTAALGIYQASITSIYPEIIVENYDIGYSRQRADRFEEAVEALSVVTKYIQIVNDMPDEGELTLDEIYGAKAYYYLGISYYYLGQYELAAVNFETVVSDYPESYLVTDGHAGWYLNEIGQ